jgi:TP901 family phage tail tape measure protein
MGLSMEITTASARTELESLQKSIGKTGTDIVSVKKKIDSLGKTVDGMAKAFEKAGDKASAASYKKLANEISSISKNMSTLKGGMDSLDSGAKKTGKSVKNLSSQLNQVSESAEKQKQKLDKTVISTSKLLEKNTQLNTKLKETESNYKKSGKAISDSEKLLAKSQKTTEKLQKQYDNLSKKSKETSDTNQRLGGRVSYLTSEISKLEKQMRDTNKELLKSGKINLDLQKKNSTLGNSYIKINTENKKLQSELSASRKEASKLTSEINRLNAAALKSGKANLELQKKVSALGNQMRKAKIEIDQSEQVIKHYEKATKKLYNENLRLTAKIEKQTAAYKKLRGEQNTLQSSMNRVMKIASTLRNVMFLAGVTMAWKRFSDDIIKVGSDFETLMKQVGGATETIKKGMVTQDFIDLQKTIMSLGESTEYTSIQGAEAAKHLAMAGFRVGQIQAALKPVMDLATAGQIELGEAAEFATGALTSMGLITSDTTQLMANMERINNALVFSAVQTNVSIEDLAESFKYVAPQARNMGMSIEDLSLWLGVLGNSNIKASAAGTQMSFALMRQAEAMRKLGMASQGNDFLSMLKEINKQGWGAEEINQVFTARGSRLILSFKNVVPVFERLRDAQKKSNDYAKELAEIMRDTTTVNFQKFSSLINNIKIVGFQKGATDLNFALKGLYKTVSDNRGEFEGFAKVLVDIQSYLIDNISSIIEMGRSLKDLYDENPRILEMAAGFATLAAVLSGNPIIATGIGAGAYTIHQMGERTKDLSSDVGELMLNLSKLQKIKEKMEDYDTAKKYVGSLRGGSTLKDNLVLTNARKQMEDAMSSAGYKYNDKFGKDISYEELNEKIGKIESDLSLKKDRLSALLGTTMNITNDLAMEFKKDSDLTKTFSEEIFAGIRESEDILTRANDELINLQEETDKLGQFGGKIGANAKGGLKYIGGPTLETQKDQLKKETEDKVKDLENSVKYFSEKVSKLQDEYFAAYEEFSLVGPRPEVLLSTEEERVAWEKSNAAVEKSRINLNNYTESLKIEQNKINIIKNKGAMEGAMLDRQIAQRNYQNLKAGVDAVRSSEQEILNTKKSFFEEYETWNLSKFKDLNRKEMKAKIQAESDKISDFKTSYELADPASKMSTEKYNTALSNMNKNLAEMKRQAGTKLALDSSRESENKRKQEYDSLKQSEETLYQLRRSNYETYQEWNAEKTREFKQKEIKMEIDAQKEVINRMKTDRVNKVDKRSTEQYKKDLKVQEDILIEMEGSKYDRGNALNSEIALREIQIRETVADQMRDLDDRIFDIKKSNAEDLDFFTNKNSNEYYKRELERAIDLENKKKDLWTTTEMLKTGPDSMIYDDIRKIESQWEDLIVQMSKNIGIQMDKLTSVTFKSVGENLKSTIDSSLSGVLTDALTGELDSFEAYFSEFTNSLAGMWSSMASNMIINQQTLGGLSGLGTVGAMGAAGLGIMAVSSIFSSREKAKAEKARKAALREQLKSELGDSIAQLELGDAGYQIYQLNAKIKDLTEQAKDAGYPIAEIIKLRKLETKEILDSIKAQYSSASTSMTDFVQGVIRDDWSMTDWQAEYDRLHEDLLSLDQTSSDYRDDSIEILNEQFEALKMIYDIQKEQLSALESLSESLTTQIWDLQNTENMPTSLENFQAQYDKLMLAATTPGASGFINTEAVSDFQDFVSQYIDKFSAAGYDYQDLISGVVGDLSDLQVDVQSESEALAIAIRANTEALEGDQGVINAINSLAQITQEIADREIYKTWKESMPSMPNIEDYKSKNYSLGYYDSLKSEVGGGNPDSLLPILGIYHKQIEAQKVLDWASLLESGISPEIDNWKKDLVAAFDLLDIQSAIDAMKNGSFGEYRNEINEDYIKLFDLVKNIPAFAKGGWSNSPSIFGETGYGEYAVPDKNNPNNSHFLQSVGVDSNEIGTQIGNIVSKAIRSAIADLGLNSGQSGDIVIKIDEREIARAVLSDTKKNPTPLRRVLS